MRVKSYSRRLGESHVVAFYKDIDPGVRLGNRADTLEAHLLDQAILKCSVCPFYLATTHYVSPTCTSRLLSKVEMSCLGLLNYAGFDSPIENLLGPESLESLRGIWSIKVVTVCSYKTQVVHRSLPLVAS